MLRATVVGQGSIGKRHSENLINLGHQVVPIDLGNKLPFDVDCAFICSPTEFHLEQAYEYLSRDIPTFIEKPLSYDYEKLVKFMQSLASNTTISMVGCNMRFHPAIRDAKDLVQKHKAIFARAEYGYYLPFWRKGDYTKSYSAGEYGGIILDDIHEVDLLYFLFGRIVDIKTVFGKVSDLDIKQEDIAETSILFENGVSASVHQDYLCKNYHRQLEIHFSHERVKFELPVTNLAYKKQVEYFMDCVKNKTQPINGIGEAFYVLSAILHAKGVGVDSGSSNLDQTSTEDTNVNRWQDFNRAGNRESQTSHTR
jgi:predicted dehydrogenase